MVREHEGDVSGGNLEKSSATHRVCEVSALFSRSFALHAKNVIKFTWTHPANDGEQLRALARLARFQARGRLLGKPTIARLGGHSTVWAHLHRWESSKIVYANPPDYAEMLAWRRSLRPGDLFVDVGANVGSYTVWAGELGAEVIALEPATDTYALLLENLRRNPYCVRPFRVAAGALAGTAYFTTGRDAGNRFDPAGETEVEVVTVDSLVGDRAVAGLKIDVEGFEIEVLRGCARALADRRVRMIQLEWNTTSQRALGSDRRHIASFLAERGYGLCRPDREGVLWPVSDLSFGSDVFAVPTQDLANHISDPISDDAGADS